MRLKGAPGSGNKRGFKLPGNKIKTETGEGGSFLKPDFTTHNYLLLLSISMSFAPIFFGIGLSPFMPYVVNGVQLLEIFGNKLP